MSKAKESNMPRRCYSYERISTGGRQAAGRGLTRQAGFADELAAEHGWIMDDTLRYIDKGRSAYHSRNLQPTAALGRFLRDIESGRVLPGSVLIVENLDRLSRAEVGKAYDLFRGILNAGIWIATEEPRRIYREQDSDNFLAILEPLFIFSRANEESKTKGRRIRDNWDAAREAAKDGKPHQNRPPAWIRRVGGGYELIPDRAEVVRLIFRHAAGGMGAHRIRDVLNVEIGHSFGTKRRWNQRQVRKILRGRTAVGEFTATRYEGDARIPMATFPGYYPAAVTEEEWAAAQVAIDSRRRKRGRPSAWGLNLFTGMLTEADTGNPLYLVTLTKPSGKIQVLTTRQSGGAYLRYDLFELAVLGAVAKLTLRDLQGTGAEPTRADERLRKARENHVAVTQRRRHLQDQLADPRFTIEDIAPALAKNTQLLRDAEVELKEAQWEAESSRGDSLGFVRSLHDSLLTAEGEEKDELRRRIKETLPAVVEGIAVRRIGTVQRGSRYLVFIKFRGGVERVVDVASSSRFAR